MVIILIFYCDLDRVIKIFIPSVQFSIPVFDIQILIYHSWDLNLSHFQILALDSEELHFQLHFRFQFHFHFHIQYFQYILRTRLMLVFQIPKIFFEGNFTA